MVAMLVAHSSAAWCCATSADCASTPTHPFCYNDVCEACNGLATTSTTCTQINANTPVCNTSTGACQGCTTDVACYGVYKRTPFCSGGPCRGCASDTECNVNYPTTPVCV